MLKASNINGNRMASDGATKIVIGARIKKVRAALVRLRNFHSLMRTVAIENLRSSAGDIMCMITSEPSSSDGCEVAPYRNRENVKMTLDESRERINIEYSNMLFPFTD